jgi:hypothetical protein
MISKLHKLNSLEASLVSGAVITGLIHLYVGVSQGFGLLTLAGAGFLGGAVLFILDRYRNLVVLASLPYTGVQFIFYYQSYGLNLGPVAAIDKLVQTGFILVGLYYLKRNLGDGETLREFLAEA